MRFSGSLTPLYAQIMEDMRCASAAALLTIVPYVATAKSPISHEDVWLMKRVEAPVPSPDGKWVVFGVTEPAYDEKEQSSDLWIVPADASSKARRITHSKGSETGPAWSPDSTRIAFSARRDGDDVAQIYVIDFSAGGEAVRITSLSTAASSPKFSPDGRSILFQSVVYPGAADDAANRAAATARRVRKYNARVYDSFPVRYWDKWLDDLQRHLFVQALDPVAKARDLLAGTKLVSSPGFAGAATSSGQELQAVWAPDSRSIVFTATTAKHEAAYAAVKTDLYQVAITGGEPRKLTRGLDSFSRPVFRPDGKALYATFERRGDMVYNLDRIARFDWPAIGQPGVVAQNFDHSVASYTFSPDSRTLYLTAEDAGHEKFYAVPTDGGTVKTTGDLTAGCFSNLAGASMAPGPVLVASFDSAVNPPEIVRLDPSTGERKLLTSFNTEPAAALELQPLREFWFTSSSGKKIHSMIALPPGFDENKKYPLFVVIHGGPHSMWRDQWFIRWNYHLLAKPGYVVLLTNYTGSTGYGEKFAQQIQGDPLAGPGKEINEAADAAIAKYPFIDASRQAAGGASYGANWLQATTTRYRCLISHAGLINLESQWGTSDTIYHREQGMGGPIWEGSKVWQEQNPIRFARQFKTPILLTVGENDFRVPLNQTLENWSVLQRLKITSRLIVFPEENHWILKGENSRFWYDEVHKWLAQWLNPAQIPSSGL
jgi:dipeptidyl aminopeptidase/acylaminoacyl peptidase